MDGIHDLGGREGFGSVVAEVDEPVFHSGWERRACGLTMGTFLTGMNNASQFRHAIERMDAVHYLTSRYYEHWITAIATRAVETGVVTHAELGRRAGGLFPLSGPVLVSEPVNEMVPAGRTEPFVVGDVVRVRSDSTRGHTRCPAYVRGRRGTIARVDPESSVPDLDAHTDERRVEPTYSVRFSAAELWGKAAAHPRDSVCVDLWHSYLESE